MLHVICPCCHCEHSGFQVTMMEGTFPCQCGHAIDLERVAVLDPRGGSAQDQRDYQRWLRVKEAERRKARRELLTGLQQEDGKVKRFLLGFSLTLGGSLLVVLLVVAFLILRRT